MRTLIILVSVLFGAAVGSAAEVQVMKGYLYKSQGKFMMSEAPHTTAPSFVVEWKGSAPQNLCLSDNNESCDRVWLKFIASTRKKGETVLTQAQVIDDPQTLRKKIELRAKLFKK